MAIIRRALALSALLAISVAAVPANPFLTGGEGQSAAPATRAPSSSGPAVGLQIELREAAAAAIRSFARDPSPRSLSLLLGAAFVYGILHAAGPGHRKTVVFSLFLGRRAAAWEPLAAGFLAAGVHAGTGIAIVLALSLLSGVVAGLGEAERIGAFLDVATFGAMAALAIALIAAKAFRMRRVGRSGSDEALAGKGLYGIVAVTSLVPCPGATMLLLFAMYADLLALGAAGVLAMSLGMGIVISAAGYLAYAGREGLFHRLKARQRLVGRIADSLEILSYLFVLVFALYALLPAFG